MVVRGPEVELLLSLADNERESYWLTAYVIRGHSHPPTPVVPLKLVSVS